MPDAHTYAQLVARYGEETVAAAMQARWTLDRKADNRWAVLFEDVERRRFERLCPCCDRVRSTRDFHWSGADQDTCGYCTNWGGF